MKSPTRILLSTLAGGLLLGLSGSAIATAIETQHNAYELPDTFAMAPTNTASGQAGRAGPESVTMSPADDRALAQPAETRYNAYDLSRDDDRRTW